MKRARQQIKALVNPSWNGVEDVRVLFVRLNLFLRGWSGYFRTGNAAKKFNQLDSYVYARLRAFMVRRKGRHLKAGEAKQWTRDFFWKLGLYRLRGSVRYPGGFA
jgi:RNA-directed DNA polymerase